jgi:hypothetical protein
VRRLHLFEWEDSPHFPAWLRRYLTDLLRHQLGSVYLPAVPLLARWLRQCGCDSVVDLCSGSGGPWPVLRPALAAAGVEVEVMLTDRFPAPGVRRVDARAIPPELRGCRTLFTAFHHFPPAEARALLARAAEERVPIAVFEFTARRPARLLGMLLSPALVWRDTLALPDRGWPRLFWTYLLPVVPLVYLWDGLVSNLRSYTPDELRRMTDSIGEPAYEWEIGGVAGPLEITYLLGTPAAGQPRGPGRSLASA